MMTSTAGKASFHRKARIKVGQIPGTKPSLFNNQLLISSGIPSLDNVIGGGLAVGSVLIVEEDVYGSYAKLMLKYFLAEAVMTKQSILLSTSDGNPRQLMKELPASIGDLDSQGHQTSKASLPQSELSAAPISDHIGGQTKQRYPVRNFSKIQLQEEDCKMLDNDEEKMKIAWRYQNKPKVKTSVSSPVAFGHYYDLTKTMSPDKVSETDVFYSQSPADPTHSHNNPDSISINPSYCQLLQEIKTRIKVGSFGTTTPQTATRNILRIGVHSLGSPLWGENGGMGGKGEGIDPSLPLFLIALRGILRSAFAVALITVPSHLFNDKAYVRRLERLSDGVLRLESFSGSDKEKNPVFKEYHGLFHLVQLPRLNSLIPAIPETTDLAFKLRRKKLTIEKLHLPPELADTTGRSQEEDSFLSSKRLMSDCGTSSSSKLSF